MQIRAQRLRMSVKAEYEYFEIVFKIFLFYIRYF